MHNFTETVLRETLSRGLNARGVAKYIAVEHVESCISETVQDTDSGKINEEIISAIFGYPSCI